ncbi:MAG: phosphoribosylamine--glycine ligase [Phycisphaerae bacterium]|nr:phosphoribosylamine--glycine ligase [Phycisphaerae bacterium]
MPHPRATPDRCNVLLIGTGGREHALAWKMRQSSRLGDLWVEQDANAGLLEFGTPCPEPIDVRSMFRTQRWCDRANIDLVVVGPEAPLEKDFATLLASDTRLVFGPTREGARLEWDKAYAKQLMRSVAIPTAEGRIFDAYEMAEHYVQSRDAPVVVKASGLAAGKGVFVCSTREEALGAIDRLMRKREFGAAGAQVVVEERLQGQELSILALVDGRTICVLDPCQDHKQVGEGDVGPNTGGMGAYCPTPLADDALLDQIQRQILVPAIDGLRREGVTFRGVLYAGIMLTPAGPKVLEFNTRFGDPETQPLMARLDGDLVELLYATAAGTLDGVEYGFDPRTACCVVVCAAGYPGPVTKDKPISGLDVAGAMPDVRVFHGSTARSASGGVVTRGGRVVGVTALGHDLLDARDKANAAAATVRFDGAFFRRDIGHRVLRTATA